MEIDRDPNFPRGGRVIFFRTHGWHASSRALPVRFYTPVRFRTLYPFVSALPGSLYWKKYRDASAPFDTWPTVSSTLADGLSPYFPTNSTVLTFRATAIDSTGEPISLGIASPFSESLPQGTTSA